MADISKIKVENEVLGIKDATARASIKKVEVFSESQPTGQEVGQFWSQILTD